MRKFRYLRRAVAHLTVMTAEGGATRLDLTIGERRVQLLQEPGVQLEHVAAEARAELSALTFGTQYDFGALTATFPVITIDVFDHADTGGDWQGWASSELGTECVIVQRSHVRPRVADVPLTFPLRILEARNPLPAPGTLPAPLGTVLKDVFGTGDFTAAMEFAECDSSVVAFRRALLWPTAEVLYFFDPPQLSAAELFELTTSWQTRVVVFEGGDLEALVPLATEVVDQGGPAVLLLPAGLRHELYLGLVHDQPLDFILNELSSRAPSARLFGGAGREDLLRVSRIVETLLDPALNRVVASALSPSDSAEPPSRRVRGGRPGAPPLAGVEALSSPSEGADFVQDFLVPHAPAIAQLNFDYESRGTLPSAALVRDLQQRFRAERDVVAVPRKLSASEQEPVRRHVKALLHYADDEVRLALDPEYAVVAPGQHLHLAIQIGAFAEQLRTIGGSAFLEEAVLWRAEQQEAMLAVGVTPLDFELFGSPLQQLRLPRNGESDIATFTLAPKENPVDPRCRSASVLSLCGQYVDSVVPRRGGVGHSATGRR